MMAAPLVGVAAASALLPFASSLTVVGVAMFLIGVANGPLDIAFYTLRQRRTDPAWIGRAFAVSMALNYSGVPVGSALAGPLIEHASLAAALLAIVAVNLVGAALAWLMLRD
jgi:predicted MFS family arabinose efflux permease